MLMIVTNKNRILPSFGWKVKIIETIMFIFFNWKILVKICNLLCVGQHVDRVYHNADGAVRAHKSGFWVVNMDVNSPRSVVSLVPEMGQATLIDDECEKELYCGLPYLIPVYSIVWLVLEFCSRNSFIPTRFLVLNTSLSSLHGVWHY
jgi:hypothetical protein